jgi:hypothetical protein
MSGMYGSLILDMKLLTSRRPLYIIISYLTPHYHHLTCLCCAFVHCAWARRHRKRTSIGEHVRAAAVVARIGAALVRLGVAVR